jgi:hypothetical protein
MAALMSPEGLVDHPILPGVAFEKINEVLDGASVWTLDRRAVRQSMCQGDRQSYLQLLNTELGVLPFAGSVPLIGAGIGTALDSCPWLGVSVARGNGKGLNVYLSGLSRVRTLSCRTSPRCPVR